MRLSISAIMKQLIVILVILLASYVHLFQIYCISMVSNSDPPCFFNELCSCSKPVNDLGHVQCVNVPLSVIPEAINQSYVYTLSFRSNGLRYIEPRSFYGTGLKGIEISHNLINRLETDTFVGLETSIRELNLRSNRLTSVPGQALTRLVRLQILNLSGNHIREINTDSDFPVNLNGSLKVLLLASNGLTSIGQYAFRHVRSLETLDLSGNNIHFINQAAFAIQPSTYPSQSSHHQSGSGYSRFRSRSQKESLVALKYLNLAYNRLNKIPFDLLTNLTLLTTLNLASNLITTTYEPTVPRRLISLDVLDLSDNLIEILPESAFRNFDKINITRLSRNPLYRIEKGAFSHSVMVHLHLDHCELVNISREAWAGLETHLRTLDLSDNALRGDARTGSLFVNDSFNRLEALKMFNLNDNAESYRLSPLSLIQSQESLQTLNLGGLPSFQRLPFSPNKYAMQFVNIRTLTLARTHIDRRLISQDLLGYGGYNLEELDFSSSSIEDISWDAFMFSPSLKLLNLSSNYIRRLDTQTFRPLGRSLEVLDLTSGLSTSTLSCDIFIHTLESLRSLYLADNGLSALSSPHCFSGLRSLNLLSLEYNNLSRLPASLFHPLTSIVHLLLSFNRLTIIESETFKMMDKLVYLDLSYNSITTLRSGSFTELTLITEINLEGNNIETIEKDSFVILPRLARLNLSFNRLKKLSFDCFDQIGAMTTLTLDLHGNSIDLSSTSTTSLTPDKSSFYQRSPYEQHHQPPYHYNQRTTANSVEIVNLIGNNITSLNSSHFESIRNTLTHLLLDNNKLTRLGWETVSGYRRLQKLSIRSNALSTIASDAFKGEPNLQIVDLSWNRLIELPSELFHDNINLRILHLTGNELTLLPENLLNPTVHLEKLDISYNRLTLFPSKALKPVSSSLRSLILTGNQLWSLRREDFEGILPRLLNLDLSGNHIKQIQSSCLTPLTSLISLNLADNPLKLIRDNLLKTLSATLEELNLSNTRLTELPDLSYMDSLISLNLSVNKLSGLTFTNYTSLINLDLSQNAFTSIPNNVWHFLPSLQSLSISSNPISFLHNDSFIGLKSLESLEIANLSLNYIQYGVLRPLSSLSSIKLSNYPSIKSFTLARLIGPLDSLQRLSIVVVNSSYLPSNLIRLPGSSNHPIHPIDLTSSLQSTTSLSSSPSSPFPSIFSSFTNANQLPKKLTQVSIEGSSLINLDDSILSTLTSTRLTLTIGSTNLSTIPLSLFNSLGRTRTIYLDVRNNALQRIGDLLFTPTAFSKARSLDLKGFYGSSNPWICDCKLAWLRDWSKQLMKESFELMVESHSLIPDHNHNDSLVAIEDRYHQVMSMLADLRSTQCANLGKSMLKAFTEELRGCRRGRSLSINLKSSYAQIYLTIVINYALSSLLSTVLTK
ncbi:chaoptin-like [Tetranychus urticae]|uniref:chaoptin-like n=1 Tax=Tetranychus urticae TaxID=32264 RepID=UPI00077BBD31|nr:chaoptin-like [Tetranychus urticae]XP_015790932.1 chaoptin-like [Tetranychus urticae]XP_015790933.1 chaoptin-like [Tetranychus urticae]XP_015790935.1 chaoptin-like [Tetranychus urticae]XP_015790936.1 chaoptin-like [Tetranychus urticae]XP_015790937.1 chaoptin-like [Tetranychus urticae]XP_015790939.1 chaoptin-like [Tetranychus urticae]